VAKLVEAEIFRLGKHVPEAFDFARTNELRDALDAARARWAELTEAEERDE
jgi:hypothetical protein